MLYDWMTFVMVGMQDFFSPVQMAASGILLMVLFLFSGTSRKLLLLFVVYFLVSLVLANVLFDMGAAPLFWSSMGFLTAASVFYCGVGVLFIGFTGILGFHWWRLINERSDALVPWSHRWQIPAFVTGFLAMALAFLLALTGTVWPLTLHMVLQGALSFSHGRLFDSIGGLIMYEMVRNAGIIGILLVMVLRWRGRMIKSLEGHKSLVIIFLAACYLSVGAALIFFHFNRG